MSILDYRKIKLLGFDLGTVWSMLRGDIKKSSHLLVQSRDAGMTSVITEVGGEKFAVVFSVDKTHPKLMFNVSCVRIEDSNQETEFVNNFGGTKFFSDREWKEEDIQNTEMAIAVVNALSVHIFCDAK